MKKIYFIFSSITFLSLYIPIVIESSKRGYKNIFILRENYKDYANPFNKENLNILEKYLKEYNIKIKLSHKIDLKKISGIVFLVDGDIYGPPREIAISSSLAKKLDKNKTIKISLTEHMQFANLYDLLEPTVDYCFFESKYLIDYWSKIDKKENIKRGIHKINNNHLWNVYQSPKNIFNINTKFDNLDKNIDNDFYYKKFNLDKQNKYCLFLYNKFSSDANIIKSTTKIINFLKKLGFTLIIKSRPKNKKSIVKEHIKGNKLIISDIYPNETLELLQISDLCVCFSSSAQTECLFSEVPLINFDVVTFHKSPITEYLLDEKFYFKFLFNEWINLDFDKFEEIFKNLDSKGSNYIKELKNKYINVNNSSSKIFNFLEEKHPELFN